MTATMIPTIQELRTEQATIETERARLLQLRGAGTADQAAEKRARIRDLTQRFWECELVIAEQVLATVEAAIAEPVVPVDEQELAAAQEAFDAARRRLGELQGALAAQNERRRTLQIELKDARYRRDTVRNQLAAAAQRAEGSI